MSAIKDLGHEEGVKKLKELAENKVCFFITRMPGAEIDTRPMSTLETDQLGNFWFLCKDDSNVAQQISADDKVELLYGDNSNNAYLFVKGKATVLQDRAIANRLVNPYCKSLVYRRKRRSLYPHHQSTAFRYSLYGYTTR